MDKLYNVDEVFGRLRWDPADQSQLWGPIPDANPTDPCITALQKMDPKKRYDGVWMTYSLDVADSSVCISDAKMDYVGDIQVNFGENVGSVSLMCGDDFIDSAKLVRRQWCKCFGQYDVWRFTGTYPTTLPMPLYIKVDPEKSVSGFSKPWTILLKWYFVRSDKRRMHLTTDQYFSAPGIGRIVTCSDRKIYRASTAVQSKATLTRPMELVDPSESVEDVLP